MKIEEILKKWTVKIVTKDDGSEGIEVRGKRPTAKQAEEIKAKKPAIIAELKRQAEEWKIKMDAIRAEQQAEEDEYLKTADLRRCLVEYQGEDWKVEHYIATLEFVKNSEVFPMEKDVTRVFQPRHGGAEVYRRVSLPHVTDTMKDIFAAGTIYPYGIGGGAAVITPEQEAQIVAEQRPAAEEAAKVAAHEKAKKDVAIAKEKAQKEAERQAKFDKAKETGKPVVIRTYMVPCSDRHEECSTDVVTEYAMPDGTTRRRQNHTW